MYDVNINFVYFHQVTPWCSLGLDEYNEIVKVDGGAENTAMCIHRGVRAKHNHLVVLHVHSSYIAALSELLWCSLLIGLWQM